MKKNILFSIAFLSLGLSNAFSQYQSIFDQLEHSDPKQGQVRIIINDDLKSLIEDHQQTLQKQDGIAGWRIRIFSDSGPGAKKEFEETKAKFLELYENIAVHQEFAYPYYKIYVGDFRTRSEALNLLKKIERKFPDAFIVQTKINYPNLATE